MGIKFFKNSDLTDYVKTAILLSIRKFLKWKNSTMANDKKENGEKKAKQKRPTALKRDLQSKKRNLRNRSFKAKVNSAVRSLKDSVSQKDSAATKTKLSDVYSLMDKGVKKGIFKMNKASRVKSRLHALAQR
jgi:small subunit ribosomal protein S20